MGESFEEDRKLFVGGLPQECSQDDLKEYFSSFGELEKVQLKMDPTTGRSRGFAFILFADEDSIDKAAEDEHKIKGKSITVKKADIKQGKIYVGKLPASGVDEDDVKNHFSEFGEIAEVIRPIDKMKNNEPKNFCFVTFEKERVAKKLIEEGSCTINGNKMMIKSVTPNPRDPQSRGGMGGGMGARGGGRGGRGGNFGGSPWMNQGGGYGGGWGGNQGGYGGGAWGGDQGYGGGQGGYDSNSWGGNQGGYGGGMGGGFGGNQGGFGGNQGGFGGGSRGSWSTNGGGKMRGGRGGGGRGGGRGRPY